jgi:HEAT repeat protein
VSARAAAAGVVALLAGGLAWFLLRSDPSPDAATAVATDAADDRPPTLVGAGAPAPIAEESTSGRFRRLLAGMARGEGGAADDLAKLAAEHPSIVGDLVDALRERWDPERTLVGAPHVGMWLPTIAQALRAIGARAVAALVAALDDDDESLRMRAAWALGEMGDVAAPALDALVANAREAEDTPYARAAAVRALGRLGPASAALGPDLLAWARDDDAPEPIADAVGAALLPVLGSTPEALDAARKILARQAADPCFELLSAMAARPAEMGPLLPALLEFVDEVQQDSPVERQAHQVLGRVASGDPRALEILVGLVANDERRSSVRSDAATALRAAGEPGIAALVALAQRSPASVRLLVFGVVKPWEKEPPAPLLELLAASMEDPDDGVRGVAASTLASFARGDLAERLIAGVARDPTIDASVVVLRLPEASASAAALALSLTRDDDLVVRSRAAAALGRQWPAAPDAAIERLRELAGDADPRVRWSSLGALHGPVAARRGRAIQACVEALADADPRVLATAARHLASLGRRAAEALPAMEAARDRIRPGPYRNAVEAAIGQVRGSR